MTNPFRILACLFIMFLYSHELYSQENTPISKGHSHNDYKQKRPLFDALENGFTSIEIDVFSFKGEARVSHRSLRLRKKPEITALYFEPIARIIRQNNGKVYAGSDEQVVLMIDLKSDKQLLIPILRKALLPYIQLVDRAGNREDDSAPLRILVSGNPDVHQVLSDPMGIFTIDGRFDQLDQEYTTENMPRASANYRNHFSWKGLGRMSEKELNRLRELVSDVHASGRKLRFYGSPDRKELWQVLLDNGVDWINVDDLRKFSSFRKQRTTN